MNSARETCLLCRSMNKNTINFYSDNGRELNIISILSTHFWFQLDEIKVLSQNICLECWKNLSSFHEFYQSISVAHKKFETVFVKIENDVDENARDNEEIYQTFQPTPRSNFMNEFLKSENDQYVHDDDESSDTSVCEIPYTNSLDTAARAFDTLPKTTQEKYLGTYDKLMAWKMEQNIDKDCFSEAVMLEYFYYLKSKFKPSTLYNYYSMLRSTIQSKNNVDINYAEVTLLLKKSSIGFQSQKSTIFQPDQILRFLTEAKDSEFLAVKVVMIFLVYGAIRMDDLTKVDVNDVNEEGSVFVIKFRDRKTNSIRSFTVDNECVAFLRKYKKLRPRNTPHSRFFLNYRKGKCTVQPIGKNTFMKAPKIVANFLNLDAENYTCFSFRSESIPNKKKTKSTDAMANSTIMKTSDASSCEDAKTVSFDVLTERSKEKYLRVYDKFLVWKADEDIDKDCFSEEVMLEYFNYLKSKYKPNTLWAEYSMLRSTIQSKFNIDICSIELSALLKVSSFGYFPQKKYSVFKSDEIRRFFSEADDDDFLAAKVVMIFGIYSVVRLRELTKVDVDDITEQGSVFVIKILDTEKNVYNSYTVEDEYAACLQKYRELRPEDTPHSRFFIHYQSGKCTKQPIGVHNFQRIPRTIAKFLKLKDVERYTFRSFRINTSKRHSRKRQREECLPNILDSFVEDPKNRIAEDTTTEICENVKTITLELLPGKSRDKYIKSYDNFLAWKIDEEIEKDCFSEAVVLDYFNYLKTKYKSSSLSSEFSMLRTIIQKNDNVEINYPKVRSFLKNIAVGFQPQKSDVFRLDDLLRFLSEAEDSTFLDVKVVMIIGIHGIISSRDIAKLDIKDVIDKGSTYVITNQGRNRSYTVDSEYATYVRKYIQLRPQTTNHSRFFVNYQNGKCTVQPIGVNKFNKAPKVIANFLNLEPENYTCHSFRRNLLKRRKKRSSTLTDTSAEEFIPKKGRISKSVSEQNYYDRSAESIVTSTKAFQSHQVQSHQFSSYDGRHVPVTSTITTSMNTPSVLPTTFQSYYVQSQQVQPYPLLQYGTGTVYVGPNDVYVQPNNATDENILH